MARFNYHTKLCTECLNEKSLKFYSPESKLLYLVLLFPIPFRLPVSLLFTLKYSMPGWPTAKPAQFAWYYFSPPTPHAHTLYPA